MPRVLISPDAIRGRSITIRDPQELHHLLDVVRVRVGDRLECFDGAGHGYAGPIVQRARRRLVVEIAERLEEPRRPLGITLAQALIRPERFAWVIQKATELGVDRISPLVTHRTVVRPAPDHADQKLVRWQRIASEAAKQCGRKTLPHLDVPQPFRHFLSTLQEGTRALMPTLSATGVPLKDELEHFDGVTSAVVLIGPEGDFTREEALLAQRAGVRLVSLGHLTLRSETAAITTLSILQHVVGFL